MSSSETCQSYRELPQRCRSGLLVGDGTFQERRLELQMRWEVDEEEDEAEIPKKQFMSARSSRYTKRKSH